MEEILIKKIIGGIGAIKRGQKTPQEMNLGKFLNMLKNINQPMYEELLNNYKSALDK